MQIVTIRMILILKTKYLKVEDLFLQFYILQIKLILFSSSFENRKQSQYKNSFSSFISIKLSLYYVLDIVKVYINHISKY